MRLLTPLKRIGPLGTALTLGQVAVVLRRHWRTIPAEKRERLAHLLRKSRGRLSNLTAEERGELRRLARQLDLAACCGPVRSTPPRSAGACVRDARRRTSQVLSAAPL